MSHAGDGAERECGRTLGEPPARLETHVAPSAPVAGSGHRITLAPNQTWTPTRPNTRAPARHIAAVHTLTPHTGLHVTSRYVRKGRAFVTVVPVARFVRWIAREAAACTTPGATA